MCLSHAIVKPSGCSKRERMRIVKKKWMKILLRILIVIIIIGVLGTGAVLGINGYVKSSVQDRILTPEAAAKLKNVDCILVLGCQVNGDGTPCDMLADRLQQGIDLYKSGASGKLLMSGDHGRVGYDEVNTMKKFATDNEIPSENVFMDHAGFSTYESLYRARDIFEAKKVIIVTQSYHLYRALYIARHMGLDAYGVSADLRWYYGQDKREVREVLARVKDFFSVIIQPKPTYLGDAIPVNGNGNLTNDS